MAPSAVEFCVLGRGACGLSSGEGTLDSAVEVKLITFEDVLER